MKFTFDSLIPVTAPYRLDYTVDALRRLAANVVDVENDGVYRRALLDAKGANLIDVSQEDPRHLRVRIAGANGKRWLPAVERMLGTNVKVNAWYERVRDIPWLASLSRELRGLRPPRYPALFESLAHAIVFQQISIHAAASIMRRTVVSLAEPVEADGFAYYPFPRPQDVLAASDETLRACGLSGNKIAHLRSAAHAVTAGELVDTEIDALSTEDAIERLCEVRGIGRWSAAVVLLRGFGRLDIFPLNDSGVARTVKLLSGNPSIDLDALLAKLGPVRGFLYFHLLLGRIRNLVP